MQQQAPTGASQVLHAANFDLWGSRLIEASAGTGKTWTIAALYLRLVLGHGAEHGFERALRPAEILVMTFTRAATRELSDRIRARLLEAAQCLRAETPIAANDGFLQSLLSDYAQGSARNRAAWLLATAAQSMDEASVHTIDAWCQRMLREHAFDSGSLFDEELVADEESLRLQAAQDYWRQQCYPLPAQALEQLLQVWRDLDALVKDMGDLLGQQIEPATEGLTLAQVLSQAAKQRAQALEAVKFGWAGRAQAMLDWLDGQTARKDSGWDGRKLSPTNYRKWLATLKDWAQGEGERPDLKTGWERFTPDGLLQARKAGAPAIELPDAFEAFAQLQSAIEGLPEVGASVRRHAAASVAQRLLRLKRQANRFGFADMPQRLDAALRRANGARLRERILAQYPAILIDEFQDTSPLQYRIFDQIYRTVDNDRHSAMLLIGDPKQSIYGFRGADIHSYLQARRATAGRHYVLHTNFRSTRALVGAVNHLFAHADALRSEGAFMYRTQHENPLPFVQVSAHGRDEELLGSGGRLPALTLVHDLELGNSQSMRRRFATRCAEQIVRWLGDPQTGFAAHATKGEPSGPLRAIRPADIAVLVRTGNEAVAVRLELARRGVASVYLSDRDSVFQSEQAQDLVHWLHAVAQPGDVRLVRAALATRSVGMSLPELASLASDDEAFDARCEQLRRLRGVWQLQGVLAMLRQTLHQFGLAARWLSLPDGERQLTNFLHLAELLQTASVALDGEQALIRWLRTEVLEGGSQGDDQIVRLESDADLVKVITVHKSKGLEYALVCLPYACSFREKERKLTSFVNLADENGKRELLLQFGDEALALADRDRLREDLRLLYVALTRARHALWVGFSALKSGNNHHCVTHKSGLGTLLGGTDPVPAQDWLALLQGFASGCEDIVLQAAEPDTACTPLKRGALGPPLQDSPAYRAEFERDWTIGSFSRLTADLTQTALTAPPAYPGAVASNGSGSSELSPIGSPRPADDEPEGQASRRGTAASGPEESALAAPWHGFTKGAQAGNFLHDQLEWLESEGFALAGNEALAAQLRRRCERAGRAAQADGVVAWLSDLVQTRLAGPDVALADLGQRLAEMEFWLPAQRFEASEIDEQCRKYLLPGQERPALVQRQLNGMLMGFADLVFEHQGRYWVLDYKSNWLGADDAAYDTGAMARSMAEHRYDVQAAIYQLALHRLLKQRLGSAYRPEQQLGGAVYLFIRGFRGPCGGVCQMPVSLPLLDALEAMLADEESPA